MADIQIIIGYETVTQADQAFKILDKTVKSTATSYEQAFNRITSWQKKFSNEQNKVSATLNSSHLAQQKSNKSARDSARVFEDAARAVEKEAASLRSLRMATDSVYRNQQKTLQMKKLLKSAIVAKTMTTEQAIVALKKFRAAQTSSNAAMGAGKNKMNGMNMAVQQAGYQFGDFAVQVQGGTSAFVAFSQQGAQLVGMLPMIAGPLGMSMKMAVGLSAAFGILIPIGSAVARMFFEMKDSAKDAAKEAETLDDKLKSLNSTLEDYADTLAAIAAGTSLDELFATRGVANATKDLDDARKALSALTDSYEIHQIGISTAISTSTGSAYVKMLDSVADLFGFGVSDKFKAALNAVIAAETTVSLLRNKEADIRASNFAQSSVALKQELELLRAQAKYGSDSAEAKAAELAQDLRNRTEAIKARVVSGELDANAAAALILQVNQSAILGEQIEANTLADERREASLARQVTSMALHLEYAARQAQITADNAAAVQKIKDSMAKDTQSQERQLELSELRVSVLRQVAGAEDALAAKIAEYARADHAAQLIKQGILGNNLRIQMAVYDALVLQLKAEEDLKRSQKATKEFAEAFAKAIMNVDFSKAVAGATVLETKMRGVWEAMKGAAEFAIRSKSVGRGRGNASGPTAEDMAGTFAGQLAAQDAFTSYEDDKPSGGSNAVFEDAFEKLTKELSRRKELLSLSKERAVVTRAIWSLEDSLGKSRAKYSAEEIKALVEKNIALKKTEDALEEVAAQQKELTDFIGSSMETAMMGIVDGTLSVEDAFKSMAREIIKELYRVLVVQEMVAAAKEALDNRGGIVSVIKSILPFADGGAFSGGSQIQAYANGGVVNSPTTFPMSGGQTGLMGEAGPEAIMPLKRGANGKLGVQMEGGRSGDVININQSFNFQANGDDTVKKLIAQAAPKIADMAKASVIDSRRRGGSTKAAFG